MDSGKDEQSQQFVVDHRKLVIGFALLIVLCGAFFVIGYMEGKRQGKMGMVPATERAALPETPAAPATDTGAPVSGGGASEPAPAGERQQLDWYKSVNRPGEGTISGSGSPPPPRAESAGKAPAGRPAGRAEPLPAALPIYSVQVGAFRNKKEAETKAASLKVKKYPFSIDFSGPPDNLYFLKVGRFESRADAVAMQLRLKQDGFSTFIKASPR